VAGALVTSRFDFLFAASGGHGHVLPMLPAALALRKRGHVVRFAGPDSAVSVARRHGFEAIGAGPGDGVDAFTTADGRRGGLERLPLDERLEVSGRVFGRYAATMAKDLIARLGAPSVVVRETMAWGGWLAADHWGVPAATIDFTRLPAFLLKSWTPFLATSREDLGLSPDPELSSANAWLSINPVPAGWLGAREMDELTHLVQPAPETADAAQREQLGAMGDGEHPLVYATLGTAFNDTAGAWPQVIEALGSLPVRAIGTVGNDVDPARFAPLPANVRLFRYLPQAVVLEQCDWVIAHGGFGSLTGSLLAGRPVVCLPLGPPDNLANAARVERLGAGLSIPIESRSSEAIRSAASTLMADTAFARAAERVAQETRALPAPRRAADLLEQLARTGEAVPVSGYVGS
jgi:UDP:flavonoid glycosyltransferase YjiC (YdhE family)